MSTPNTEIGAITLATLRATGRGGRHRQGG
jgi:hypothetical protein